MVGGMFAAMPRGLAQIDPRMLAKVASSQQAGVPRAVSTTPGAFTGASKADVTPPGFAVPSSDPAGGAQQPTVSAGMFGNAGRKKPKTLLGLDTRQWAGVVSDALLSASAASGNQGAAMMLQNNLLMRRQRAEDDRKSSAAASERERIVQLLMGQGLSYEDAQLAALAPEKFGEEFSSRFRTRETAPEETVFTPGIGGAPTTWTAPKIFEDGPNRVQVDPNNGTSRTLYEGDIGAEHEARAAGLVPGTPDYQTFIKDRLLDAQGPTGVMMNREDNAQSDRNNIRSTSTSEGNSIRSSDSARFSRNNTPVATTLNGRGETVVTYPDGRVTTLRGSQDPRGQSGGGRGRAGSGDLIGPTYKRGNSNIRYSKSKRAYVDLATGVVVR